MRDSELKKLMESRMRSVEFSEAEILILHAVATIGTENRSMTKLLRKRITPIALKILEERPEYTGEGKR